LTQQAHKHRLAVDHIVEAIKPSLGYVRHHVPVCAKDIIGKRPGDQIGVGEAAELLLGDYFLPKCTLVGHMLHEANRLGI
jgi:hypothetical protein